MRRFTSKKWGTAEPNFFLLLIPSIVYSVLCSQETSSFQILVDYDNKFVIFTLVHRERVSSEILASTKSKVEVLKGPLHIIHLISITITSDDHCQAIHLFGTTFPDAPVALCLPLAEKMYNSHIYVSPQTSSAEEFIFTQNKPEK